MTRIQPVSNPSPKSQELMGMINKKLGRVPNMLATLAHSPAALEFYVAGSSALGGSSLSAKDRERIALFTAVKNSCGYCLKAHTAIGKGAGLNDSDVEQSKTGKASDQKSQAVLNFTKVIIEKHGLINDADYSTAKSAGLSDGEIMEVVTAVAFNIFTNFVNHVADPVVDF